MTLPRSPPARVATRGPRCCIYTMASRSFIISLVLATVFTVQGKQEDVVQRHPLPWWHPKIQTVTDELMPAPPGHPLLDEGIFQDFVEANTNKGHRFFDGPDGYLLNPWDIGNHPSLDPYFVLDEIPNEEAFPIVYFDHPDIHQAFMEGKSLPREHPSVSEMLNTLLPPNHPDIDELFMNDQRELPEWHPDLALMMNIRDLPKGDPSIPVYFAHPSISEAFEKGNPIPQGHPSVTDMLISYLPPGHPDNLDEMMEHPSKFSLPFGHPSLDTFISVEDLPRGMPLLDVYFSHPNITEAFEIGSSIPTGHPSVTDMLESYLPPGHPVDLDEMLENPLDYSLPFGHPSLHEFVTLPQGLPSILVYFDHPNISDAFEMGRPLPKDHPSVMEMLSDHLPQGHPENLDEMMKNPSEFSLPFGHPSLEQFVSIEVLPQGLPSIPVYFDHPNISDAFDMGRPLPKDHPSVIEMLSDHLPPGHPENLDEMMKNPSEFSLPFGHPSLEQFVSIEVLPQGLPSIPVYFDHPNISEAFEMGRALPPGHPFVNKFLFKFIPPGHPTNLNQMMKNPSDYKLPFGHPSLEQFVSIEALPQDLPSIPVFFSHPNISEAFEMGRPIPKGHPSVTNLLSNHLPPGHPGNLDQMMKNPSAFPLPFGHPILETFISIEELPRGLPAISVFSGHPDIEESLRLQDPMPKSHPSVTVLLQEYLPPGHPADLDSMLEDPINNPLPLGHPILSQIIAPAQETDFSDTSRVFLKATEIKFSVFNNHPDLEFHTTEEPVKHHPAIHHLFTDFLPSSHPDLDLLMEQGFTLPRWHPDITTMVAPRELRLSPGALLCYILSAIFVIALMVRNTKSWMNSKSTKKIVVVPKQTSCHPLQDTYTDPTFEESSLNWDHFDEMKMEDEVVPSSKNVECSLPKLDHRNTKAMELHKIHHDANLTSEVEPIRTSIITYQEKRNTRLRSAWLGGRICGTHLSNGDVIFRLLYIVLNVAALLVSPYDFNVGIGSLAAGNIVFLVISATKNSVFTWFLGVAFDQTIAYHRFLGYVTVGFAFFHACFYFDRLVEFMSDQVYKTGFIALLFGICLTVSSLDWIRRRYFNVFYWSHLAFVGFIVCVYLHAAGARPFILASIAFYALDKMLHVVWTQLPRKTLCIEKVGSRGTALVRVGKTPLNRILGRYKVGQYVFVNFPELSLTEWHPFSVASGPSQDNIDLYIRALGNHTKRIVEYSEKCASENKQALIRIDGPYGNLSFNYRRYGSLVLVAGGIGITPLMSLIEDIYESNNTKRKISHCIQNIRLVWVMPFASEAVIFLDKLLAYRAEGELDDFLPVLDFSLYITREVVPPFVTVPTFLSKPDFSLLMDNYTNENKRDGVSSTLVFACGPGKMVNQLWDASTKSKSKGLRVDFHHESFEF